MAERRPTLRRVARNLGLRGGAASAGGPAPEDQGAGGGRAASWALRPPRKIISAWPMENNQVGSS